MEPSPADRILAEWDAVSRAVRAPGLPVRSTGIRASRAAPSMAMTVVFMVVVAIGGSWFAFRLAAAPVAVEGSPSPAGAGNPEVGLATWWVDPMALPLPEDSIVIPGFIREHACASGRPPEGRVNPPTIEYRTDAIVITFTVRRVSGRCPSNPLHPVEVRLTEPLAGRRLLDGSELPRRDATVGLPSSGDEDSRQASLARALMAGCQVTRPETPFVGPSPMPLSRQTPEQSGRRWFGTGDLWTILQPEGEVWGGLPSDHGLHQKTFWWSKHYTSAIEDPSPDIEVSGARLDGPGAFVGDAHTTHAGFGLGLAMLVGVTIPTGGCWTITARYQGAELSYVVWVEG